MNNQIFNFLYSFCLGISIFNLSTSFVVKVDYCQTHNSFLNFLIPFIVLVDNLFQEESFAFKFFVKVRDKDILLIGG